MTRNALRACRVLLAVYALMVSGAEPVEADAGACGLSRDVGDQALDEMTWRQLNTIYGYVAEQQYGQAFDDLQKMLERAGRDTYLQAIVNQALAQVEWSRENFEASLGFFEHAVELDSLPDRVHYALMYQIAQLYFMQNRYDEALARLDLWFCTTPAESITAAAWVLQASILAGKEDNSGVLSAIGKAISLDPEPRESWYQLMLAARYQLEQYPQAAETLELMITKWPGRKTYWIQLSQLRLRMNQDELSLAVLALAHREGLLDTQADVLYLSSLYRNAEVPYKAADVLETGIRNGMVEPSGPHWTAVAASWYAADELEKSLLAYEEAGRTAGDGAVDLQRGFILIDLERWPAALDALNLALEKGGLDESRAGEAYLLRGMAQFNLGDMDSAGADWKRAQRNDKTREAARQWLNYLQEERRRGAS